jgi:D-alanyl-D-alanine carboxypeptidase
MDKQIITNSLNNWQLENDISCMKISIQTADDTYKYNNTIQTKYVNSYITDDRTLFEIGSITKNFIAIIILDLIALGKLNLEHSVGDYCSIYPKWNKVTIKQLLSMRSNIPDFINFGYYRSQIFQKYVFSPEEILNMIYAQDCIYDKYWYYSNTNYLLLGKIIERIYNSSLENILKTYCSKYQLKNTYYSQTKYAKDIIDKKINGYFNHLNMSYILPSNFGATAGILMDIDDLLTFVNLLLVKKTMLSEQSLLLMCNGILIPNNHNARPLNTTYGLGIFISEDPEYGKIFWNVGLTFGYSCLFLFIPHANIIIVVAINQLLGENNKIINKTILFPKGELIKLVLKCINILKSNHFAKFAIS